MSCTNTHTSTNTKPCTNWNGIEYNWGEKYSTKKEEENTLPYRGHTDPKQI